MARKAKVPSLTRPPVPIWSIPFQGPWLVFAFKPTTLWSLRTSMSTSSGGKTLLVPTPYSFKLAIVDAGIQQFGIQRGVRLFEILRGRPLRISPPEDAVVSAALVKLRKLERVGSAESESDGEDAADVRTFAPTVGFREYVSFYGADADRSFRVAIARSGLDRADVRQLADAACAVTYSGKRGGFLQCEIMEETERPREVEELPTAAPFTIPLSQIPHFGIPVGTIQPLDELAASAEWDRVSSFGPKSVRVAHLTPSQSDWETAVDRAYVPSAVPYRLIKTTRSFAAYRRVDLQ